MTLAGHAITGGWMSLMVTVNEQLEELPAASLALQVTVDEPFGKLEPDGGAQTGVTAPQLSAAVTLNGTTAEQRLGSLPAVMFPGQLIVGA